MAGAPNIRLFLHIRKDNASTLLVALSCYSYLHPIDDIKQGHKSQRSGI
jgi:hypothetical protein